MGQKRGGNALTPSHHLTMLRFNNGYFGACICVLALLGTAISGFVMNVDQESREVTKYSYVADVSGLFSYSDAPEYIAYNPSSNYTGYSGAIIYTPTTYANNYRYISEDGAETSNSTTVDYENTYPEDYGDSMYKFLWNGTIDFGSSTDSFGGYSYNGSLYYHGTKLTNVLDDIAGGSLTSYSKITIELTQMETYPVLFYAGDWQTIESGGVTIHYAVLNEGNSMPDKLVYSPVSNQVDAYRNNALIWSSFADNVGVLANYGLKKFGYLTVIDTSVDMDSTLIGNPTYSYMQPNAGVQITSSTDATWTNGYENSIVDVKIIRNGDSHNTQYNMFKIGGFMLLFYLNGSNKLCYSSFETGNVVMGDWLGVQMRIDALSGNIILTPTNDVDLTRTVEPNGYSITLEGVFTPGAIESFKVSGASTDSFKFQVTDTMVFLNTYNTVMIDPSLEITDWFPTYTDYRLNFYSFAIIGDSITINGQVCPVNRDNGTFTFDNVAGFEFTKKMENFYITFLDGHTYITFANDGSEYDLGETTDTTVSFDGMWYFTTGLWQSYLGTETYWNWDLSGFQASAGECLLIFLGIIGFGTIVYIVWGKGKLGFLDWLVIIFAVFLASAFLGF